MQQRIGERVSLFLWTLKMSFEDEGFWCYYMCTLVRYFFVATVADEHCLYLSGNYGETDLGKAKGG